MVGAWVAAPSATLGQVYLWVADRIVSQVRGYNVNGSWVTDVSGGALHRPTGLTIGPDDNLYVVNNFPPEINVERYNPTDGTFIDVFVASGSGGLLQPHHLEFGPDGNLYVTSTRTNSVKYYQGPSGPSPGAYLGEWTCSEMVFPIGLAFRADGQLMVSHWFDLETSKIERFSTGGVWLGRWGSAPQGHFEISELVFSPDGSSYLYGVDFYGDTVLRWSGSGLSGGAPTEFVSAGSGGLNQPSCLLFGPDGNLYVSMLGNTPASNTVNRYNGTTGAYLGVFVTGLQEPQGLAFVHTSCVAPTIQTHPANQIVCGTGGSATFTVVAGGMPAPSYQWRFEGGNIPGATGNSYTINPVTPGDVGRYDVVVSNSCGSATSNAATLALDQAPSIIAPADLTVSADAGGCFAVLDPGTPAVSDDRTAAQNLIITAERSDGGFDPQNDPYSAAGSPVTITWTVEDECGNTAQDTQVIKVNPVNEMIVNVELSPTLDDPRPGIPGDTLDRCITFEFWRCPSATPEVVVEQVIPVPLDRGDGRHLAAGVSVLVDCGSYNCVTAQDKLHTLRRTDDGDFAIVGNQYVADFTSTGTDGDDSLIGGNLNGDGWIDIVDFGRYMNRFGASYGVGDTTCLTLAPHADITGDGLVGAGDFTFIQSNFLARSDPPCCDEP